MRRVCVTGIGIVTSLGHNREDCWRHVTAGLSGADYITAFDARDWPTQFACEVKNFSLSKEAVAAENIRYLNRPMTFGMEAAHEAIIDSQIDCTKLHRRIGVSVGANIGALSADIILACLQAKSSGKSQSVVALKKSEPFRHALRNHPGTFAGMLSMRWGIHGGLTTIQTACASSGQAIGHAFRQIKRGQADAMIAGGADSLSAEMLLSGFCLIGALSQRNNDPQKASRPFDKDRDGFVAGEGAAVLVLEEMEMAKERGAKIYAEIVGYGETASAFRITDLPPNGRGLVEAMKTAMSEAQLGVEHVDYVNAHGTSTELNDRVEALAVRRVFGARGHMPLMSSTKSSTGHLISAAGALEAAFSILAIRDKLAPPTINLVDTDCGTDIDFVPNEAKSSDIKVTLSNSVGFGGSNSALVFKEVQE